MKGRIIRTAAALAAFACLTAAAVFSYKIYDTVRQDREGKESYAALLENAVKHGEPGSSPAFSLQEPSSTGGDAAQGSTVNADGKENGIAEPAGSGTDPGADTLPEDFPEVDMAYLKSVSPNIVGWLYSPGTVIDYPVVQGEDNSYYLTHLADGSPNRNGCLFIDCDNAADFSDDNTILYGHHMQSGAMFASLVNYADQDYYEAHPYLYLVAEGVPYRIDVFSGYDAAVSDTAYSRSFATKHDFARWMRQVAAKSDFQADLELTTDDRIVTLSTCAYSFDNARYVLHGRLVRLERKDK